MTKRAAKPPLAIVGTLREAKNYMEEQGLNADYDLLLLGQRADLYLLYGRVGIPYVLLPNSEGFEWLAELTDHERAGRILPLKVS